MLCVEVFMMRLTQWDKVFISFTAVVAVQLVVQDYI